jgi:Mor family transcriptional regulator
MCEIWGGRTLYVPAAASPKHPIARDLGEDKLNELCRHFGGQRIYLPNLDAVRLVKKQRMAKRMQALNMNHWEIAEMLGVTTRTVTTWLSRVGEEA